MSKEEILVCFEILISLVTVDNVMAVFIIQV